MNMKFICIFAFLRRQPSALAFLALGGASAGVASAQERPYFITYDHQLEEPGNLEIGINPLLADQRGGGNFLGGWTELEYGVKAWWTTELYLSAQATRGDSALFTGYRWENRFRPLMREHRVNPVLYIEYESINGADKSMLGVVNHDGEADHATRNAEARLEHKREIEAKLILSSNFRGWNASFNGIAERHLEAKESWEFGYAAGLSRPLALAARPDPCSLCPENFAVGVELYGGLGTRRQFGLSDTSHYLAPVVAWNLPSGLSLRLSPGFGLTGTSHRFLLRLGASYEFSRLGGGR
ncbi:MAG: hypothetical protein ABIR28_08275 [Vicinamibacteria bacterium]